MKSSCYTDSQILTILKQVDSSIPVAELCREYGMSNASFYKWRIAHKIRRYGHFNNEAHERALR